MKLKHVRRLLVSPFTYALARIFIFIIQCLPHRWLGGIADLVGRAIFSRQQYRKLIMANLALAFPEWSDEKRAEVGRKSAINTALTFLEFLWLRSHRAQLPEVVRWKDGMGERYRAYVDRPRGLILISPHVGNWEAGSLLLNSEGLKLWVVARTQRNPLMDAFITSSRSSSGGAVIHEKGAVREMLRLLRSNESVALLIDQNTLPHEGGMFVEFFGIPVPVSRAPVSLALKTDAEIVVGACIRGDDGKIHCEIRELGRAPSTFPGEQELCQEVMKLQEEIIREHPEQYLWLYRRFRYIPAEWGGDWERLPFYSKRYDSARRRKKS